VGECAKEVFAARENFPASTFADLYDPVTMPPALTTAHETPDRAVDRCYRKAPFPTTAKASNTSSPSTNNSPLL